MTTKKAMPDTSAYFEEPTPVTVRTRKKEHKFLFHDLSKEDVDELYKPAREAIGDDAKVAEANAKIMEAAVEKIVSSENNEFFSADQIRKLPANLLNKIGRKVLAFMAGQDVDAAGEDDAKPADAESQEQPEGPKA